MIRHLLLLLAVVAAYAAEAPPITARTELQAPAGTLLVGQPVTVVVTLESPTWFSGVADFHLPQVPGLLLAQSGGHPLVGNETVDGATVTTQRWELTAIARRAGTTEIPAFPVSYLVAGAAGAPPEQRTATTTAVSFTTAPIPGAGPGPAPLFAPGLEISETWKPEPADVRQGAAFTRTVVRTVRGLPAQLLPPLAFDDAVGVRVYPKEPVLVSRTDRGDTTGTRTDAVIYQCEQPGDAEIPALTIAWYDPEARAVRTRELPAHRFAIAPDPARVATAASAAVEPRRKPLPLIPIAVIGALGILAVVVLIRRRRAPDPEAVFFRRASSAADDAALHAALQAWLAVSPWAADGLTGVARRAGDADLERQLAALERRLFAAGGQEPRIDAGDLLGRLRRARKRLRKAHRRAADRGALAPLAGAP